MTGGDVVTIFMGTVAFWGIVAFIAYAIWCNYFESRFERWWLTYRLLHKRPSIRRDLFKTSWECTTKVNGVWRIGYGMTPMQAYERWRLGA